jgi:hypothetical protein
VSSRISKWIVASLFGATVASVGCNSSDVSVTVDDSGSSDSSTLSLLSVSPQYGAAGGGTVITLTGTGFDSNTVVQLGTATCINANVVSSTEMTCTTRNHSAGAVTVSVTNGVGSSAQLSTQFIYFSPLVISPGSATVAVGTSKLFSASGGISPYTFSLSSGTGCVTAGGLYTGAGTQGVVKVRDSVGNVQTAVVTVNPALAVDPTSLTMEVNEFYQVTASGGVTPYTYFAQGGGYMDGNSSYPGLYHAPSSAGTTSVQLSDAQGTSVSTTVTVKAYGANLDYVAAPAGNTVATAYLTGPTGAGYIYVAGYGTDASSHKQWFVRRSSDNGASWGSPYTYQLAASNDSQPYGMGRDPSGNLYTVGSASDGTNVRWVVLKSIDNGASWSPVDNYLYSGGSSSEAHGIAADSSGNLYVAGTAVDSGGLNHWLVRMSNNGGSSWTISRDTLYSTSYSAKALGVTVDHNGYVFVCGTGYDSGGVQHWIVEVNQASGASGSWTSSLNGSAGWQLNSGFGAQCSGIATSSNGLVFTGGWSYRGRALLRRKRLASALLVAGHRGPEQRDQRRRREPDGAERLVRGIRQWRSQWDHRQDQRLGHSV